MKKNVLFILLLFLTNLAIGQRTISGTISDDTGPIPYANVIVKGLTVGTVTDIDGNYELKVPEGSNTLVYSFIGYTTQEIEIGDTDRIDVLMREGVDLETVVVTQLGIARKEKSLGYAVQTVGGDEINEANTTSLVDALSAKSAGVNVGGSSGSAGASSRIVIRGATSLTGNNQALVVVDGVKMNNSESTSRLNDEDRTASVSLSNRVMDLNTDNIESVTILKGAAATALYGVDGARGVILVTTKKGEKGKMKVEIGSNITVEKVSQLPELQGKYAQGVSGEWIGPDGNSNRLYSWGPAIDTSYWDGSDYAYDKNGRIVGQNDPAAKTKVTPYDNLNSIWRTGVSTNNNFAISGGNDLGTFRLSLGHSIDNGIIPTNSVTRTTVGLSTTSNFLDKRLKVITSVKYSNSGGKRIQQGSNTSGLMLGLLRTPISFDNANGLKDPVGNPEAYIFADGTQRNYRGGAGYDNPYWVINNAPFYDDVNRIFGTAKLSFDVTDWLTVLTNIGVDNYTDRRTEGFEINSSTATGGRASEDEYTFSGLDAYFHLLGRKSFGTDGKFSFYYNFGANVYKEKLNELYVKGDGLVLPDFIHVSNATALEVYSYQLREKKFSIFGEANIGYNQMLYLGLTGRKDWVSTLDAPETEFDRKSISFPYYSLSLGFVFSELLKNDKILSFGKFRLSNALVGNGAPRAYLTGTTYNNTRPTDGWTEGITYPYQGTGGFSLDNEQGNPNLKAAYTIDFETGLDLRFFKGRLNFDMAYYRKKSKDEIVPVSIAPSTGFREVVLNSGELTTNGLEIVLDATVLKKKDFTWNVSINFDKSKTVVDKLADGLENLFLGGFTGTGIYNFPEEEYGLIYGGTFLRDDAGNLIINDDESSLGYGYPIAGGPGIIGNPNPDFRLGINNSLSYKGVSLSFLWDIKQGGDMWNGTQGALTFFGMSKLTEDRDAFGDAGTQSFEGVLQTSGQPNNIIVPLDEDWYTGNGGGFGDVDEHFIQDASYYRLRLLSLSYRLSNDLLEKLPFEGIRLSFTARNLLLFTPYEGVDPETSLLGASSNGQGIDYFNNPGTKSFAIGLNLTF